MNISNKQILQYIVSFFLLVILIVIIWQLFVSLRMHKLLTNADSARLAGKPIPVRTVAASFGTLNSISSANCTARESSKIELISIVGGNVATVNVKLGDRVKSGQALAKFDDADLKEELKSIEKAEKTLISLGNELRPFLKELYKLKKESLVTSFDLFNSIERLKRVELDLIRVNIEKNDRLTDISNTLVVSPIEGIVTQLNVDHGTAIRPYGDVAVISKLDPILIECGFSEDRMSEISDFDTATAHFSSFPEKVYAAELIGVLPELETDEKLITARFSLANPEYRLLAGMQAVMNLGKQDQGISIPAVSLVNSQLGSAEVFTVDENNQAFLVRVKTGRYAQGYVQIIDGLKEGERVVVAGQGFLQNSDQVIEAEVEQKPKGLIGTLFPGL